MVPNDETLFDKVVNLSKRRGFVFQSAEIYGGFRSTYDSAPLGRRVPRHLQGRGGGGAGARGPRRGGPGAPGPAPPPPPRPPAQSLPRQGGCPAGANPD